MTLESRINKNRYIGNGATTQFPFTFKIWKTDQILVYVGDGKTEQEVSARCTIALTASGGSVTFPTAPASGTIIVLRRKMPYIQEDDYRNGTRFDSEEIEDRLDQDCAERQDLRLDVDRAVKVPETSNKTPEEYEDDFWTAHNESIDARNNIEQALNELGTEVATHSYVLATNTTYARTLGERFSDIINVKDFGAKGNGVTPDSTAIQAAIDAAYDIGTAVFFPSGTYVIDQTLTVSGVYLCGVIGAYAADNGTVLMGATGAETIMQTRTSPTAKDITFGLSGLRLTNCAIGCDFGYVVECDFEDISIDSTGNSFQLGRHIEYMPLFNTFKGCRFRSTSGHALALDGSNGCNNNSFYNCIFKIDDENSSAIRFYVSGGYGSVNNVFYQCEITGNGIGLYNYKSQNTSLYQCYMENYKTAIYLAGASNLCIYRCVFGSLRGQGESYIYFPEGGTIVVDGATIYPRIYEEDKNQYFIGFNENSTATKVVYINGNVVIGTSPIGFNRYQPNLFKDTIVSQYGRVVVRKRNQASVAATLSNGTTGIRIRCNGIDGSESQATGAIDFNESTAIALYPNLNGECGPVAVAGKNFRPLLQADDGIFNLGMASYRWNVVYAATGAIDTSDARFKTGVEIPDGALMRAWSKVNFKVFQFKDAISKKGSNARLHIGVIAQEVDEAFKSEGLDASRYGLFCYDEWEDEYEDVEVIDSEAVLDSEGNEVSPAITHIEHKKIREAGNIYGIRYEEALALECAYQRWRLEQLEKRVNQLTNNTNN